MKKVSAFNLIKISILILIIVNVLFPIISLIGKIEINDIWPMISNPIFSSMIKNSLVSTSVATLFSVFLSFMLAWLVCRSNIKHKNAVMMLFTLPMLIPSISHGMGLVLLLGDNGFITNLLGINIGLYGIKGIVLGSILYSFPVAFVMFCDAFKYEDFTVYEVAEVLGMNKWQQFKTITFQNIKGVLLSVVFATFTMIFSDYGVPLIVGGKYTTIPVYMYQEVIGMMNFSRGAILSVLLLIPAFIAFILDVKKSGQSNNLASTIKPYVIKENKKRDCICYIICATVMLVVLLPIISFIILSFVSKFPIDMTLTLDNLKRAIQQDVLRYLYNSISISLGSALIGIIVIYLSAYISARSKKGIVKSIVHLLSIITLAIPGIVLGLCFVLFFNGTAIYGTVFILIVVNVVHFFASPYLMAYNSLINFTNSFEDVASVYGISKLKLLIDVFIPNTRSTIVEMYSYLFVNSMVTISAVSFLASVSNMPLALLIPQFDSQSMIEISALISVIILLVNMLLKIVVYYIKRAISIERI